MPLKQFKYGGSVTRYSVKVTCFRLGVSESRCLARMKVASTSVPGALVIWRGLHRVCSTDLPHFVDVCDKSQYRILSLAKGYRVREQSRCKRRDRPDRRSRTSVCRRLRVRADPTLHLIDRSVSALLVHRFGVTLNIFGRELPTILGHVLRDHDRARVVPFTHGRSGTCARGGVDSEVDGCWTNSGQETWDRGDVRCERFGRGWGGILAESDGLQVAESKVLRAAKSREHDRWRAADLPPSHQEKNNKDASLCALRGWRRRCAPSSSISRRGLAQC